MTANINPDTGIAYGYISADALHPDTVNDLQMDGTDVYYEDAVKEEQQHVADNWETQGGDPEITEYEDRLAYVKDNWEGSPWEQHFNDHYQPDEPIHEGERDGVKYRTSWLGGALNVWVFESPHIGRFQQCSPCVPNAANLDHPDPDGVEGYDVPPEWRDSQE